MSPNQLETVSRLRAANPVDTEVDLGRKPIAQAALERILSDHPAPAQPRRRRFRLPRRGGLGVGVALLLAGGGAAIATTNPFGWWSPNPNTARYEIDPGRRVATPTVTTIACADTTSARFDCAAGGRGQRYMQIDSVQLPGQLGLFTRDNVVKAIQVDQRKDQLTKAQAARFLHDLSQVPDSFFPEFRLAMTYGTVAGGDDSRVPPRGVPEWLVCQDGAAGLACQDLNGDAHAPIGAGIYVAQPSSDWRPAPRQRPDFSLPPGITFTGPEYRVLADFLTQAQPIRQQHTSSFRAPRAPASASEGR